MPGYEHVGTFYPDLGQQGGLFGSSVSMKAGYIAIGAQVSKSVYTLNWTPTGGWQQSGRINSPDSTPTQFGRSVELTNGGLRLAIGSPQNNSAYVYYRTNPAEQWTLDNVLSAHDIPPTSTAKLGSVSILSRTSSPDTFVAVGTYDIPEAVYVFARYNGRWAQEQKLVAPSGTIEGFGFSVSLSTNDRLLVGARFADNQKGAAYIYRRIDSVWTLEKRLTASDGKAFDRFGTSVSLSGTRAIIGAPEFDAGSGLQNVGKAYIFDYNSALGDWVETTGLIATGVELVAGSKAGISVAVNAGYAVIGAPSWSTAGLNNIGCAYYSIREGTSPWTVPKIAIATELTRDSYFGNSVAIYPPSIETRVLFLVGAPYKDRNNSPTDDSGAAYLFAITP